MCVAMREILILMILSLLMDMCCNEEAYREGYEEKVYPRVRICVVIH